MQGSGRTITLAAVQTSLASEPSRERNTAGEDVCIPSAIRLWYIEGFPCKIETRDKTETYQVASKQPLNQSTIGKKWTKAKIASLYTILQAKYGDSNEGRPRIQWEDVVAPSMYTASHQQNSQQCRDKYKADLKRKAKQQV